MVRRGSLRRLTGYIDRPLPAFSLTMAFRRLLKIVCVRLSSSPGPKSDNKEKRHQKLSMLVQTLSVLEKAGEASGVPYLKGALALALEVAQAVEGYRSNNEDLDRLALHCGTLMKEITTQLKDGGGLSKDMELLVKDLCDTFEEIQNTANSIIGNDSLARRFLAQRDNAERLRTLSKDLDSAQLKFMTLASIANAQNQEQAQDPGIYDWNDIDLTSEFGSGDEWIAFSAKLRPSQELIIVKRYNTADISARRAKQEADIKAFQQQWHPNLLQYRGRSHPRADGSYTVLKGVTSDHVSQYIAIKFSEDNQHGSVEALRLLKDLTVSSSQGDISA
ncbi:hypothetical protein C8R47DRAFT_426306 [Mycena vitilis]|nr:hypothetical protein C8R47DRAFT_426306 [Mycena vitilis]